MDRWSLPGPASFLVSISEALRDGESIVIGVPLNALSALTEALEDRLGEEWRTPEPLIGTEGNPLGELCAALNIEDDPSSRRGAASFLAAIDTKHVIIVSGVTSSHWQAWQEFLDEYANASRSISAMDRTLLVVLAAGLPKSRLPRKAPALRAMIWDAVVGEADVFSYVTQSLRKRGRSIDGNAKLMARVVTRLALWDFDLVDHLLDLEPRALFQPKEAVLAASTGHPAWERIGEQWEDGGAAQFDGEKLRHSVAIARSGDDQAELDMRLWAAQASELLPALEINRRQLAKRMKEARLKLPVLLNGEEISDLLHLEIGPLRHLARTHRLPPDIVRLADKYWHLRNKLAHLWPLDADEALDPEVFGRSAN
jgi:hypothetical protein